MPRRRGGKEFKKRQIWAIAHGKPAQKRGNNRLLPNILLAEAIKHLEPMSTKIKIVSNVRLTTPVFIVDPVGPILLRRVGSPNFGKNIQDSQSQTDSEATTVIYYQSDVITID